MKNDDKTIGEKGTVIPGNKSAETFIPEDLIKTIAKSQGLVGDEGKLTVDHWQPGVYRKGKIVQHHIGQFFSASKDTATEPGDSKDWKRLGSYGFRYAGEYVEEKRYQPNDLIVKDGSLYLHHENEDHLLIRKGDKGDKGEPGLDGKDAIDGIDGKNGKSLEAIELSGTNLIFVTVDEDGTQSDSKIVDLIDIVDPIAKKYSAIKKSAVSEVLGELPNFMRDFIEKELLTNTSDPVAVPIRFYRGAWDSSSTYESGDVFSYGGALVVSTATSRGTPPDSLFSGNSATSGYQLMSGSPFPGASPATSGVGSATNIDTSNFAVGVINTDATLATVNNNQIPTALAVKTYVDNNSGGITGSSTDTFTNKTFDANATGNSLSNIEVADFAASALNKTPALTSASDTQLPSAKAVKDYVDNKGSLISQGTWNASTNTPALVSGTGTKGFYYTVATAGTTTLDGINSWAVGDQVQYDGTVWRKVNGSVVSQDIAYIVTLSNVSSAADATNNTTLINTALQNYRDVYLVGSGNAEINSKMIIPSNTRLRAKNGLRIRQRNGTYMDNMLVNSAYENRNSGTPVTPSWTVGHEILINWANHGIVLGDYVWMRPDLPQTSVTTNSSQYIGVFRVKTITDANNIIVFANRNPTGAPSISGAVWVASKADVNIEVSDIFIDQNQSNNSTIVDPLGTHACVFGGIANSLFSNMVVNHAQKYCFELGSAYGCVVKNLKTEITNSDLCKFYGPMVNCSVDGLHGESNDDVFSCQTKEPAGFMGYTWGYGDLLNITVENITASTRAAGGAHCAVVYGSPEEFADNITIKNVFGKATNYFPVSIAGGNSTFLGNIGRVTIENVKSHPSNVAMLRVAHTLVGSKIDAHFKNCIMENDGSDMVKIEANADVRTIVMDGCVYDVHNSSGTTKRILDVSGKVGHVVFDRCRFIQQGSQSIRVLNTVAGAVFGKISMETCLIHVDNVFKLVPGVTAGQLSVNNCDFTRAFAVFVTDINCNCSITNSRIAAATGGVIRTTSTPTVTLKAVGNDFVTGGSWVVVVSGTPVISLFGYEITADVGATGIARTAGAHFKNSGSGRGTLVQNELVICDTTNAPGSYKQLTNTSNNF